MSLIHEALQKAESERRAGQLPPLVSATPGPRRGERKSIPGFWLVVGLALLGAVAYSNRDLIRPASQNVKDAHVDVDAAVDAVEDPASPPGPRTESAARKPARVAEQAPAAPAAPVMDAFTAAQADAIAAHMGAGRGIAPESTVPEVEPPAEVRTPPMPVLPPASPTPAPVEIAAKPEPAVPVEAQSSPLPAATAVPEPTRDPSAPAPATASATASAGTPLIYELPLATRQALPPLKVTMQVYHPDPALRFAIIDGKRVNENGPVGNDLNLIEIQRDAILFEFRGTRFLLPRLGR